MQQRSLTLQFTEYETLDQLPIGDQELYQRALTALPEAYAPYSGFQVAAAARTENGQIMTGCNTENAAYPMCICAERAALAAVASQFPNVRVESMAITVKSPSQVLKEPASPCGACRQVLAEHEQRYGHKMRLILRGEEGPFYVIEGAGQLLPLGFSADFL